MTVSHQVNSLRGCDLTDVGRLHGTMYQSYACIDRSYGLITTVWRRSGPVSRVSYVRNSLGQRLPAWYNPDIPLSVRPVSARLNLQEVTASGTAVLSWPYTL
jgi:hypothetical protein